MCKNNLRICRVHGRLGYFHEWVNFAYQAVPVYAIDSCQNSTTSTICGVVEFDDRVVLVNMSDIKFCDSIHEELRYIIKDEKP